MARSTRVLFSLAIAAALAVPSLAGAQAIPRPVGGGSSGSSGGSSGSSGGSSGGSSSSGGGSGSSAPVRASGEDSGSRRAPSRVPSSSASRRGAAVARGSDRPAPAPGGVVSGGAEARTGSSSSRTDTVGSTGQSVGRNRDDRPVSGFAAARPVTEPGVRFISFPLYGPWGRWYPWYGSGFGWNYGFVTYDPWRYGATRWYWGRYGMWYDPYSYSPYYYDDYYGGARGGGDRDEVRFGSIRVKADPKTAKVYVDGALVGVVDDFDGLTDHLELEAGAHQLEIRADGYQPYVADITVEPGKTRTERIKLTRVK